MMALCSARLSARCPKLKTSFPCVLRRTARKRDVPTAGIGHDTHSQEFSPEEGGSEFAKKHVETADLEDAGESSSGNQAKLMGSIAAVLGIVILTAGGYAFKDQIGTFLTYFSGVVDSMGPLGYALFALVYTGLEVLALPAIPLTMASGAIFGIVPGSILVSLSGTVAATISFIIARYAARDRFLKWAQKNKQFRAVNTVIERDGFKVVTLLRLSPLLPLAASNYLYGLTNVTLSAFFFGSWVGMFPGTLAYVSAGHFGKAAFMDGEALPLEWWQVALGVAISASAIAYIGSLAKAALQEEEALANAQMDKDHH